MARRRTRGPRPTRRVLVKVGYACNNNCVFCHSTPHRGWDTPTPTLLSKIGAARRLGAEAVVLSGGEPTLREDLLELAGAISRQGMRPGLVTNARCLSYPGWTDALCEHGLDYVYLSLCGPDADLHDRLTRATAFEQTLQALSQLAGKVEFLTVNVVVQAANLDRLSEFGALLYPFRPLRLKFSLVEPEGAALDAFERVVPPLAQAARAVREAVAHLGRSAPDLALAVDGFPLCQLPGIEALEAGLREDGFFAMSEAFEQGFFPVDDGHRSFGRTCLGCSLRRRCRGVFSTYLERCGQAELAPVSRPVSNSFQIVAGAEAEPFRVTACPVRSYRLPPPDAIRGMLIQSRPGWAFSARVDTRDFSDETLRVAIRDRGQVYRAVRGLVDLDDFLGQLDQLERCATCGRCPRRTECGGFWMRARRPAFEHAQGLIHDRLRGLQGRVLDVGCGAAPYAHALEPALRAGRLEYLGIDPALPAERLEPPMSLLHVRLEDLDQRAGPFDTILALRSLNHLADPLQGLGRMASLTRSGGRVLLAEDVVFGLVRTARQAERISTRGDLAFEHHMNLDLGDAIALAGQVGLNCLEAIGTDASGCTLWLLDLQRG